MVNSKHIENQISHDETVISGKNTSRVCRVTCVGDESLEREHMIQLLAKSIADLVEQKKEITNEVY